MKKICFSFLIIVASLVSTAGVAIANNGNRTDVNKDGIVDIFDGVIIGWSFGDDATDEPIVAEGIVRKTNGGEVITTRQLDFDKSGKVDMPDLLLFAKEFGMSKSDALSFLASINPGAMAVNPAANKLKATWGRIKNEK